MSEVEFKDVLVCVDPQKLDQIWPHVSDFIHRAYVTGIGDDTAESMKAALDARRALLWVVWDGSGLLAAAITSIEDMPAHRICIIRCCAGRELHRWRHFIGDLEKYAKDENCDLMRIHGRQGWKHIFPDYREPWIALEKELT